MTSPYGGNGPYKVLVIGATDGGSSPEPSEIPAAIEFNATAGESLSALRVVYSTGAAVFSLSHTDTVNAKRVFGLTMSAAGSGSSVRIRRIGVVSDASWAWLPGFVWLGLNGQLTQSPPTTGVCLIVGEALSATQILLTFFDPTFQE